MFVFVTVVKKISCYVISKYANNSPIKMCQKLLDNAKHKNMKITTHLRYIFVDTQIYKRINITQFIHRGFRTLLGKETHMLGKGDRLVTKDDLLSGFILKIDFKDNDYLCTAAYLNSISWRSL